MIWKLTIRIWIHSLPIIRKLFALVGRHHRSHDPWIQSFFKFKEPGPIYEGGSPLEVRWGHLPYKAAEGARCPF